MPATNGGETTVVFFRRFALSSRRAAATSRRAGLGTPPTYSAGTFRNLFTSLNGEKMMEGRGPLARTAAILRQIAPRCYAQLLRDGRYRFTNQLRRSVGGERGPKLVAAVVRTAAEELLSAHGCSSVVSEIQTAGDVGRESDEVFIAGNSISKSDSKSGAMLPLVTGYNAKWRDLYAFEDSQLQPKKKTKQTFSRLNSSAWKPLAVAWITRRTGSPSAEITTVIEMDAVDLLVEHIHFYENGIAEEDERRGFRHH
nr:hypothetical protein Iba_chr01eCG9080 [Ipomoea batatas]